MILRYIQTLTSYPYVAKNKSRAFCDVELYSGDDGKYHVFLFERKDNPGMSVTNAIETVASQFLFTLRGYLKIHAEPGDVVWYDVGEDERDLSRVDLSWDPRTEQFHDPKWTHVADPREAR